MLVIIKVNVINPLSQRASDSADHVSASTPGAHPKVET